MAKDSRYPPRPKTGQFVLQGSLQVEFTLDGRTVERFDQAIGLVADLEVGDDGVPTDERAGYWALQVSTWGLLASIFRYRVTAVPPENDLFAPIPPELPTGEVLPLLSSLHGEGRREVHWLDLSRRILALVENARIPIGTELDDRVWCGVKDSLRSVVAEDYQRPAEIEIAVRAEVSMTAEIPNKPVLVY